MLNSIMKASFSVFGILIGTALIAVFPATSVHAIPAYCNWDSTTSICCGRILICSFPAPGADLWCGGAIVPIGSTCPY